MIRTIRMVMGVVNFVKCSMGILAYPTNLASACLS